MIHKVDLSRFKDPYSLVDHAIRSMRQNDQNYCCTLSFPSGDMRTKRGLLLWRERQRQIKEFLGLAVELLDQKNREVFFLDAVSYVEKLQELGWFDWEIEEKFWRKVMTKLDGVVLFEERSTEKRIESARSIKGLGRAIITESFFRNLGGVKTPPKQIEILTRSMATQKEAA